jgi:hypothetical protein
MRKTLTIFVLALSVAHHTLAQQTNPAASSAPSCVNEKGAKVDWYFAIRIPARKAPVLSRNYIVYDSTSKDFRNTDEEIIK